MVVSSFLGAMLIAHLLSGELSFLSEVEASRIDANTDHLTGLLNRRGLELIYPHWARETQKSAGMALLYFDIDRFKTTNDQFGHAVGDDVLKHVVDAVAGLLRHNDTFVRLGGDEFAVILPDIATNEAEQIAERCRATVREATFILGDDTLPISISVGAVWTENSMDVESMLNAADSALYEAKALGRNAVVFKDNEDFPQAAA